MPYAHCDACHKSQDECLCRETCSLCGIRTNHTTAQHEQAEAELLMCRECERPVRDPDDKLCPACMSEALSEMASYYYPEDGGQG